MLNTSYVQSVIPDTLHLHITEPLLGVLGGREHMGKNDQEREAWGKKAREQETTKRNFGSSEQTKRPIKKCYFQS